MTADAATMTPALSPGDKVGYFEVRQPLAAGGMSLLWEGYDKLLDRKVAIKQIADQHAADESIRETFRKEAEIQKKVSAGQRYLVEVIDFIDDARGLFLIMEYVQGGSLEQRLDQQQGPLDPKQALDLIQRIARGLAAIHDAGVIHRDLKPANILLPTAGGVKICDFGLAVIQQEQGGLTMGTARYMAPELFTEQTAEPAADIYALGVIAHEMTIGRPAFNDAFKTILRDQRNQAVRWMKWHTNRRLAVTPAHQVNAEVPEPLGALIQRMMEKDPQQRIQSAPQLLEVLKRNFAPGAQPGGQPAAPRTETQTAFQDTGDPTAPLPAAGKWPLILLGVLAFNLLLFGGIGAWYVIQQNQAAQARAEAASEAYDQAMGLYEQGDYSAARDAFAAVAGQYAQQGDLTAAAEARAELAAAHVHAAEGRNAIEQRNFQAAVTAFSAALAAADRADAAGLLNRDPIAGFREDVRSQRAFAEQAASITGAIDAGRFDRAVSLIRQFREAGTTPSEGEVLDALSQQIAGRARDADIQEVLDDVRRLESDAKLAEARGALAQALERFEGNTELQQEAERLDEQIAVRNARRAARTAENGGNLDEAIRQWQTVQRLRPDPETAARIAQLRSQRAYQRAVEARRAGDIRAAEEAALQSLAHQDNQDARQLLEDIGRAVEKQDLLRRAENAAINRDYDQAARLYQQVLDNYDADPAVRRELDAAMVRRNVEQARTAIDNGNLDSAEALLNEALDLDRTDPRANRLMTELERRQAYRSEVAAGDRRLSEGRYGEAKQHYARARDILREAGMNTDPIQAKLTEAEYEHLLANARTEMRAERWNAALGYVKSALNMRDTREARELQAEIEKRIELRE